MFRFVGLTITCDIFAALVSQLAGQYLRLGKVDDNFVSINANLVLITFIFIVIFASYFCELYTVDRFLSHAETAARIAVSITIAFLVLSAFFYVVPDLALGRGVLGLSLLIFGILQYLIHRAFQSSQVIKPVLQKVMILGVGPLAEVIERTILHYPRKFAFAGFIQPNNGLATVNTQSIVGTVDQVEDLLAQENADQLVVSISERRGVLPVRNLLNCKLRGVDILDSPTFYERATGKLLIESIQPSWFIYSAGFRMTPVRRSLKRFMDVIFSFIGLLITLPFFPLIALLIRWFSPGPVFFRQKRVGERGKEFTMLKFRTMRNDAEKETGAVWAKKNDPRITRFGWWMRNLRIDEIPQLFNVLRGEMSFIGPRPERKEFVDKLSETIAYYGKRHFVKPGITGYAQVSYPYGASVEDALEKLRFDLYYIKNYSITLDIIILIETIKVVLLGRGGR